MNASVRRLAAVADEAHCCPATATAGQELEAGAAMRIWAGVILMAATACELAIVTVPSYGDGVGTAELTAANAARMKEYCIFDVGLKLKKSKFIYEGR